MDIKFSRLSLPSSGVAVIAVTEENIQSDNLVKFIDKSPIKFTGKKGQIIPAAHPKEHDLDLVLLGLGETADLVKTIRDIGGTLSQFCNNSKIENISVIIDEIDNSPIEISDIAAEMALALV